MNRDQLGRFFVVRLSADLEDRRILEYKDNVIYNLDYAKYLIEKFGVENFFLYGQDSSSWQPQTRKIRELTKREPLFSADFERGIGCNATGGTDFPGNMALAATGDPKLARKQGQAIAKEMKYFGLNWNYAPAIDVNYVSNNPAVNIRSFGDCPETVAAFGSAIVQGFEEEGVLSCIKHYPGHGSLSEDSHSIMPTLTKSIEQLEEEDLYPFIEILKQNITSAVMIAHIHFPSMQTEERPASFSREIINDLREQKDFKGLIVPDALEMEGAYRFEAPYGIAAEAIKAGHTLLLAPNEVEDKIIELEKALEAGYITEEQLKNNEKILNKYKKQLAGNSYYVKDFAFEDHQALSQEIAQKSICGFQTPKAIQSTDSVLNIDIYNQNDQLLTIWKDRFLTCESLKEKSINNIEEVKLSDKDTDFPEIPEDKYNRILISIYLKIVLGSGKMEFPRQFVKPIKKLQEQYGDRLTLLVYADPYQVLETFPHKNMLFSYSNSDYSHKAMANILTGQAEIEGRFPIKIK